MRARSVKPGFFKNELLATSDPLYGWIFEGLWCLSDRSGRLEDRSRRIHLEINAGRAYEGTVESLKWLSDNGFITRYECNGVRYIQVNMFAKHQNPHIREPSSTIPAPDKHSASTGPALLTPSSLTPDSPFLTPDSCNPESGASTGLRDRENGTPIREADQAAATATRVRNGHGPHAEPNPAETSFARLKAAYPRGIYREGNWLLAEREAYQRVEEGSATWEDLIAGADRYAKQQAAIGNTGTQFVLSPEKFFARAGAPWREIYPLPAPPKPAYVPSPTTEELERREREREEAARAGS